ncbi:acyl-CoA dehydrogenase family protein [Gordonia sp. TBRC 11910]|uniref:Acyl-CoA dehydrogenase family protein n=1 Tax=Gordonia asplenii TaxID=2725283 RepID=A0A848KT26_9ACTN|nr:acyl-CoA dehydrogenase family protein [Gordonia asplenii]NMO00035.1 acyl-CoA dehydrogenase family protein [Gordonia asplenii]
MAIDFTLSNDQLALQQAARTFATTRLVDVEKAIADLATPDLRFYALKPFYQEMVDAGFLKALIPVEQGGAKMASLDFALAAEELTSVDINVPTALLATGLGLQPIIQYGSPEQKDRWLRPFTGTESTTAAFGFTEAGGGANFDSDDPSVGVRTHAYLDGDDWVINGAKHYTTNGIGWDGLGPDLITLVCRTDLTKPPQESLAVIVIPRGTPGVEITGLIDTVGHRACISPKLKFTDVRVPAENILGKPGDGMDICRLAFNWTASLIGAACVGRMRAAFDFALTWAKTERRNGPVPVIDYQNAGYMLVDIKTRIEAARYLTWKACHHFDITDGRDEELGHMAKVHCSELSVQAVYDTMRLVGVDGYGDQTPIAAIMNDVLCFPVYDGGNMGVRRRQLHALLRRDTYNAMASAEGRLAGV